MAKKPKKRQKDKAPATEASKKTEAKTTGELGEDQLAAVAGGVTSAADCDGAAKEPRYKKASG